MGDYITIQCKSCGVDISIWKYSLTRKTRKHNGICKKCADIIASEKRTNSDRDYIYLKKQLRNIIARCSGKYEHYKSYTRKGISVCKEWIDNADSFVCWARSNGWERGLTIDRIDNNGNYEPSNCRWIPNERNVLIK